MLPLKKKWTNFEQIFYYTPVVVQKVPSVKNMYTTTLQYLAFAGFCSKKCLFDWMQLCIYRPQWNCGWLAWIVGGQSAVPYNHRGQPMFCFVLKK